MDHWLDRQTKLIGEAATERIKSARVAVIGLGGVGGAALEALARCGVGSLYLLDRDVFELSNINRQILATVETIGRKKSAVAKERVLSINPDAQVTTVCAALDEEQLENLFEFSPDWVIDAIDNVTAKLELIAACKERNVPIICSMGTGNRMHSDFAVGDMSETVTSGCPLARVMRRELKKRGIREVTALYCTTPPIETGMRAPSSIAFAPPVAGYKMAEYVINCIAKVETEYC